MKKNTENILLAPINLLVWMSHNPAETMLLSVFGFSCLPFFMHIGSPAMLGGLMTFFAWMAEKYIFKYEKQSKLYQILCLILLIIGVVAIFIVGEKQYNSIWSSMDNMLSVYMGSFFGMMIANIFISFIENEREEIMLRREKNRIYIEKQKEQKIIAQKEKDGFIAIRRNGNVIGYIEKEVYDEFVNNNIKKQ